MHLHVLASGSKGNATVVEGPEGSVLIDCGLSYRELCRRADEAGTDLGCVRALLLTHEHSDHVSGVSVYAKHLDGDIVATAGTISARSYLSCLPATLIDPTDELELCGMRVRVFPTSHDVADPVAFRFETDDDALGYCTDTGFLTPLARVALRGCRILALESNHDAHMLRTGPYPAFLKARVASQVGHLSNDQAAEALCDLVTEVTETVVAMHLSEKNNRPSTCIRTLAAAVGAEAANSTFTEARTPDGTLTIVPAAQGRTLSMW